MANFWQSIKNAACNAASGTGRFMQKHWNNGNILKWTNFGANAGMSAIATYGTIDAMVNGESVFGGCCGGNWGGWGGGCCSGSYYPDLSTINTIMARNMCDPMGIVNDPMAQMYLGAGMYNSGGMFGGTYGAMFGGGADMFSGYGNYSYPSYPTYPSTTTTPSKKSGTPTTTTEPKKYEHTAANAFTSDNNTTVPSFTKTLIGDAVTNGQEIKISEGHSDQSDYGTKVKNAANALGSNWDTDKDGYVNESEFLTGFMKDYNDLTNDKKKILFKQLDLNNDKKLDKNELSAMLWHMDASDKITDDAAKNDGKITSKGFSSWLTSIQTATGREAMNAHYNTLFKDED